MGDREAERLRERERRETETVREKGIRRWGEIGKIYIWRDSEREIERGEIKGDAKREEIG